MNDNPYQPPHADPASKPHSGAGIACFAVAMTSVLLELGGVSLGLYLEHSNQGEFPNESLSGIFALGALVTGMVINQVGAGLGLAAIFQRDRSRLFAVLGFCINVALFVIIVIAAVVGQRASP